MKQRQNLFHSLKNFGSLNTHFELQRRRKKLLRKLKKLRHKPKQKQKQAEEQAAQAEEEAAEQAEEDEAEAEKAEEADTLPRRCMPRRRAGRRQKQEGLDEGVINRWKTRKFEGINYHER